MPVRLLSIYTHQFPVLAAHATRRFDHLTPLPSASPFAGYHVIQFASRDHWAAS